MQLVRALVRSAPPSAFAVAVFAATLFAAAGQSAQAEEGTVSVRGAYYKERSTRVAQPMVDADLETSEDGRVAAHFLVDSITSASVAAGAAGEPFTETRYEGGGSYTHELGELRISGGGRLSYEPDYTSLFAVLSGEIDLAEKNTTVAVALAQGRDSISNAGLQDANSMAPEITGSLNTTLASASITQILTPSLVGALTYDFTYLSGFQQNVYRAVPAGGVLEPERVPETRIRNAVFANVRGYLDSTRTIGVVGYRLYFDDWGIVGHTPEARVIQELAPELELHARYRFHKQSQAEFYKPIYDTSDPDIEPFLTSDQKLTNQRTQIFGVKLDGALGIVGVTGRFADARVSALFEYTTQTTTFGNAIAGQLAFTVPLVY